MADKKKSSWGSRAQKKAVKPKTVSTELTQKAEAKPTKPEKKAPPPPPRPVTAPVVIPPPKSTADRVASRFKNLLPDIEDLTKKIIASDLDHTQAVEATSRADDLVDWAPNVLVWCADKRFLGMRPFAKQAEILLHLYEEWCPMCSDNDYVMDIPVADPIEQVMAKIALLEFGKCPHCGLEKDYGRKKGLFKDPLELIAVVGQRAGKSAVASMAISYLIHRNAMLPVPWKSYRLTPGQVIDFTVVATTMGQSEKTLWSTLKGIFENSHWFKAYKIVSDEEAKKAGAKAGVVSAETYIWFEHKRMLIYFAANNPSGLRGTTRFGAAIDELGWFDAEQGSMKVRANGPETYAALSNACLTLRGKFRDEVMMHPATTMPIPLMINISSPRSMDDAIMSIYRDAAKNPRVIRKHWATWEMNPTLPKQLLIDTGDLLKSTGSRDYAAQPPLSDDPLISRVDMVTDAFKTPLAIEKRYGELLRPSAIGYLNEIDVQAGRNMNTMLSAGLEADADVPRPDYAKLQNLSAKAREELGAYEDLFDDLITKPAHTRPHIMGVDLGSSNNALAVVCGYLAEKNERFVTDFAIEVKPDDNKRVNLADIYDNLIVPLVERLNVVAVYYDRWSSLHQIHDLCIRYGSYGPLHPSTDRRQWLRDLEYRRERPAFIADQYSLNMADAVMLVSRLEQGDCVFPAMEIGMMELMVNKALNPRDYPFAHLALQMATVRARGNRLLKPATRDDDLFRAWANCAVKAFRDDLVIDLLSQDGRAKDKKVASVASHVSLSMAGKGIRQVANMHAGAHSSNSGQQGFPVILRKRTFKG